MTKTIYVGKNNLYQLLKKNNNSVDEINQKLSEKVVWTMYLASLSGELFVF